MNKVLVKWSQHFLKECHEMWLCQLVSHNITTTDTNNVCKGRLVTLCMCKYITDFCLTTVQTVSTLFYRKKNSLKEKRYCCDNKLLTIKTYLTTNNVMGRGGKKQHPSANNNVATILTRAWSTFTVFHAVNIKYRYTTWSILKGSHITNPM